MVVNLLRVIAKPFSAARSSSVYFTQHHIDVGTKIVFFQ